MLNLPEVQVPVALVLIATSFFFGHYTQELHQAEVVAAAPEISKAESDKHLHRRDLRTDAAHGSAKKIAAPSFNPLNTVELERFMLESSGLLQVRPPITPAKSGDNFYRVIPFQILSWMPRLVVFPAFMDPDRCDALIKLSNASLAKSGIAFKVGEKWDADQEIRTSDGTYLSASADSDDGVLAWLEERIAAASLVPSSNSESFNVLRYGKGQKYDSHMDTFDPKDYGPQSSQRIATILVYLTDVEEGGETIFKKEGWQGDKKVITDFKSCKDGYLYRPRRGDAVLFWATQPNGDIDEHALHGGCPVIKGTKWVATKWLRSTKSYMDRAADAEHDSVKAEQASKLQAA